MERNGRCCRCQANAASLILLDLGFITFAQLQAVATVLRGGVAKSPEVIGSTQLFVSSWLCRMCTVPSHVKSCLTARPWQRVWLGGQSEVLGSGSSGSAASAYRMLIASTMHCASSHAVYEIVLAARLSVVWFGKAKFVGQRLWGPPALHGPLKLVR
eukprot:3102156-Amphidinium_carterae.1